MITADETMNAVQGLFACALGFYVWRAMYPVFRVDDYRQRMFAIRDDLFDFAAHGNISFEHPAYKLLRQSMNGYIRYGHRLTFGRIVLTMIEWQMLNNQPTLDKYKALEVAIRSIKDKRVRLRMEEYHSTAMGLSAVRLVRGSIILSIMALSVTVIKLLTSGITSAKQSLKQSGTYVSDKLIDPRLLEEEARRYPCESF